MISHSTRQKRRQNREHLKVLSTYSIRASSVLLHKNNTTEFQFYIKYESRFHHRSQRAVSFGQSNFSACVRVLARIHDAHWRGHYDAQKLSKSRSTTHHTSRSISC